MSAPRSPKFNVRRLGWKDQPIGTIDLAKAPLVMVMGLGSGLARRHTDPAGEFWAVGDRGPNIKPKALIERYGHEPARALKTIDGAKVMPKTEVGPAIARLRIDGDRLDLLDLLPLTQPDGSSVSGLPNPSSEHARCEPAFDLEAKPIDPDPSGLDTEGIAALAGGGFWVGDEFGPSLVRLDGRGRIERRYVPEGTDLTDAAHPVETVLPAIAGKRQLNRGFEAIAVSPDERWLYLAFQSPLAHPDEAAHKAARHTRLWRFDAATLKVTGQYAYPFDDPASFARDAAEGEVEWGDIKVSELVCLEEDRLLVLERVSQTTKFQIVELSDSAALSPEHLDPATRPTLEQLSQAGKLPALRKRLVFSTDDAPEVAADMEGMVVLSPRELLLVNDNDFGVEGARTEFWLVTFAEPVF